MRKIIVSVWAICCVMNVAMAANRTMGQFIALKGADGINGINGTNGTDACPSRIYQTTKTNGCYQIKSQAQKRVSGNCTDDASVEVVTLDNVCDGCTPTYSKQYIHGSILSPTYNSNSANAIGTRLTVSGCDANPVNIDTYDGDDGTSFNYLGTVANCNALPTSPTPSPNDAYLVKGTGLGRVCIYTGNGWPTCPDDCAEFTGPAGDNNCTGLETSSTAVKNTTLTYSGPTKSDTGLAYYTTKGKMTTSHTPCNPNVTLDDSVQDDACTLITAPSGSTCTGSKKAYYECTTQAAVTGLAKGATYNLCVSTAGDSIADALSGKEDTLCVGNNAQSSSVERKKTVTYTAPSGSGSHNGYSWNTVVGKVVNKSVKCDGTEVTLSSIPDKCVELEKPTGVCTASTKVYYQCTRSDNGSSYDLCASGNSVLSAAQTAAESAGAAAAAAVDPCGGSTSSTQIKSTSTTSYNRGTKSNGVYSSIGKSTITKTACDGTTTYTSYEQDNCVEIAKPANTCTGATSAYLQCTTGSATTDATYYVCQNLGENNNSLAGKIETAQTTATNAASAAAQAQTTANGKIDAGYLSTNGYLTSSSSLPAANLTGTINSGRLPSNVVTTTDNKISASVLPDTVVTTTGGKIDASVLPTSVTTTDNLKQQLLDQTIMGTCTTSGGTGDNAPTTSCTSGSLMEAIYNQLSAAISAASRS